MFTTAKNHLSTISVDKAVGKCTMLNDSNVYLVSINLKRLRVIPHSFSCRDAMIATS